jgi:hypothetical protein
VLTPVVSQNDPTFRGDVYRPNSGNAPTP